MGVFRANFNPSIGVIKVFDDPFIAVELFARGFLGPQVFWLGTFTWVRGFSSRGDAVLRVGASWDGSVSAERGIFMVLRRRRNLS